MNLHGKEQSGQARINSLSLNLEGLARFARQMRLRQRYLPYASVRILPGRAFCDIGNSEEFPILQKIPVLIH